MLDDRRFKYTQGGFIQATLTFLEQNKDIYPDAYERAKLICVKSGCLENGQSGNGVQNLEHGYGLIEAASSMEGILRGITTVNGKY